MTDDSIIHGESFVYKLYSTTNDYYYYGSTMWPVEYRYTQHFAKAFDEKADDYLSRWIRDSGIGNIKCEAIGTYKNITELQLIKNENDYIIGGRSDKNCLNKKLAYNPTTNTPEEKERRKKYYEENKERVVSQRRESRAKTRQKKWGELDNTNYTPVMVKCKYCRESIPERSWKDHYKEVHGVVAGKTAK